MLVFRDVEAESTQKRILVAILRCDGLACQICQHRPGGVDSEVNNKRIYLAALVSRLLVCDPNTFETLP
jgi:hypothetical protein